MMGDLALQQAPYFCCSVRFGVLCLLITLTIGVDAAQLLPQNNHLGSQASVPVKSSSGRRHRHGQFRTIKKFDDLPFSTDSVHDVSLVESESRAIPQPSFFANLMMGVIPSAQTYQVPRAQYTKPMRSRPFIWIHVHKAGGTFICNMAHIAGEAVVQPSDGACNWIGHDQYKDSGHKDRFIGCEERYDYFKENNYTWGQIEREFVEADKCFDQFDYGVMLREPIALLTSGINYHSGCSLFTELTEPCGSAPSDPEGFLYYFLNMVSRHPIDNVKNDQFSSWKFFDNIQTRILASALSVPPGGINSTHVEAAKRAMEKFKVVARLEDMPKIGPSLFSQLGWNPHMDTHAGEPINANANVAKFLFTEEEKAALLRVNQHDVALYEWFKPNDLV